MSFIKSNNSKYALVPHESDEEEAYFPNLGELKYIRHVGEGGMSKISLYHLNKDGLKHEVAVKTLFRKTVSKRELTSLKTEATILSSINHDNIIRIYGITKTEFGFGLVLEYLPNGSYSYFFRNLWEIPGAAEYEDKIAPLKIRIISEVVSAMEYLHQPRKDASLDKENRILHLDLKGENVLLKQDLHVKICDFGLGMLSTLTKLRTGTTVHGGIGGTPGYIPPERLRDAKCKPNTKSDVYSFGILQYEILTDLPPYPDFDASDVTILAYHVAEKNFRPDLSKISSTFPNELQQLMQQCWSPLPDTRPPFSEISERMIAVQKEIDDFEKTAAESVTTVMAIIANEKMNTRDPILIDSLPDMETWMESRIESENDDSYDGSTIQNDIRNPGTMTLHESETIVKTAISSPPRGTSEYHRITDLPPAESNCQPDGLSATHKSAPISLASSVNEETRYPESVNDDPPPFPVTDDGETKKFNCFLAKILLPLLIILILVTISIVCWILLVDAQGCRTMKPPDHGIMTCEKHGDIVTKCSFTCDHGYSLVGFDSSMCINHTWTSKEPSCKRVCKRPQITHGTVYCPNGTLEGSTCEVFCSQPYSAQGNVFISCLTNGKWSKPFPTCVCPICQTGENCEYMIRWQKIDDDLSVITPFDSITVHYGRHSFECLATLSKISTSPHYTGKCHGPDTNTECHSGKYLKPKDAARASAAAYIRQLMAQKKEPKPCDSEKMPVGC